MTDLSELKSLIAIPEYREVDYNVPHYLTSKTQLIMPLDVGSYPNVQVNPVGNAGHRDFLLQHRKRLSPDTWQGAMPFNCDYPRPEEIAFICGLAMSQGCAGGGHGFDPEDDISADQGAAIGSTQYYRHNFTTKDNNDLRLWSSAVTVLYEEPPATYVIGELGLVERHNGLIINDFSFGTEIGDSMVASLQANGMVSGSFSELEDEAMTGSTNFKNLEVTGLAAPDDVFNDTYLDVDPTLRPYINGQALSGQNMAVHLVRRTRAEVAAGTMPTYVAADAQAASRNMALALDANDLQGTTSRIDITKLLFSFRLTYSNNFNASTNREFGTGALARGHRGSPFYTIGLELSFRRNRSLAADVRELIQSAKDGDQWGIQIVMRTETLSASQGKGILWTFPCMQIGQTNRVTVNNELANRLNMEPVLLESDIKPMYLDVIDAIPRWHDRIGAESSDVQGKFPSSSAPEFTSD